MISFAFPGSPVGRRIQGLLHKGELREIKKAISLGHLSGTG